MAINCKLNKTFRAAKLKPNPFRERTRTVQTDYGEVVKTEVTLNGEVVPINYLPRIWLRRLDCCGISELVFSPLHNLAFRNLEDEKNFDVIVAKALRAYDHRIVIAGLPVRTQGQTIYREKFYRKLYKVLKSFGFVDVHERVYTNNNSNNKLKVVIGQL